MTETVVHYIGGKATKGASSRVMDVYNRPRAEESEGYGNGRGCGSSCRSGQKNFPSWPPPVRRARNVWVLS